MAEYPTPASRLSAERSPLDFSNLDLQDSNKLGKLAAGAGLILLGGMGRSSIVKLGFTLGGAALLFTTLTGRKVQPLKKSTSPSRSPVRKARGVMREDQTLAHQRTRGGGVADQEGVKLVRSITVDRPREDVYRFWKDLQNLPHFMDHVESIHQIDDRHSHWIVRTPGGAATAEWYMEIINDHPDEMIAWQSMPGADLPNAGSVRFASGPEGGTIVRVTLEYLQPTMAMGVAAAAILGDQPDQQLTEDLGRMKVLLEAPEERNRFAPMEDESL